MLVWKMKWMSALLAVVIVGCSPAADFDCCEMTLSVGEEEANIMVCDTSITGSPITEMGGEKYMTFYDPGKYKCACEDKKIDDTIFTVPAGNYTDEPFKIDLFKDCGEENG